MILPELSSLVLHHLGNLGALLILSGMIYSIRKRFDIRIGSPVFWLVYHRWASVIGLVLVLVHSEGRLYGIAGLSIIMMMVITVSGFTGLFIYTRIPRDRMGKESKLVDLERELDHIRTLSHQAIEPDLVARELPHPQGKPTEGGKSGMGHLYAFALEDISDRLRTGRLHKRMVTLDRKIIRLNRQISRLETARSLLAGWRSWHNLMSALFLLTVVIHVLSILYFGDYPSFWDYLSFGYYLNFGSNLR